MNQAFLLRLGSFFPVFAFLAVWELLLPRRDFSVSRLWRWLNNFGLQGTDLLALVLGNALMPALAVEMARAAESRGWGLLNQVSWSFGLKFALAFLFLDFVIYAQHWLFHAVPLFWRMHKVHHTDLDLDVTTGLRFHPLEIIVSLLIKLAAVTLIGAHFLAVVVFEIVLNATSLFTHANVRLPRRLEPWLRLLIVTPDMHRVHHSARASETNSNFGFNLPWWDRLLGTYEAEPAAGHLEMTLGLPEHRKWRVQHLFWLLALPFK